jgi:hypothetical protein
MVRFGIKKLQDNKDYPLAEWPEWPALFERAFWAGCNEAVEYNNKPKQPAPQAADAGEKQSDKPISASCCDANQQRGQKALAAEWTKFLNVPS